MVHLHPLPILILCISLFSIVQCKNSIKEVDSIPGYNGQLKQKVYQGYIGVSKTKFINFMFFSPNQNEGWNPLILWLQGGPGSSGFLGMLTELGPFSVNVNSFPANKSEVPQLFKNPYAWTDKYAMIFVESPVGTGYSHCEGPCPVNNDTSAADDMFEFVKQFFIEFPDYLNNDFYIAGESYGGIYVPMLAERVMNSLNVTKIKFEGVMVGNGCTGMKSIGGCSIRSTTDTPIFLYEHGQISTRQFSEVIAQCATKETSAGCQAALKEVNEIAGVYNEYSIYDTCYAEELINANVSHKAFDYLCYQEQALQAWVTHPEVKTFFNTTLEWQSHDGDWDLYKSTQDDVVPIYAELIKNNIDVLIYFGDTDLAVPYFGGERWIMKSGYFKPNSNMKPWGTQYTEVAGRVQYFNDGLTYVTIRGSGHMVPRYKPSEALSMVSSWIRYRALDDKTPMDAFTF